MKNSDRINELVDELNELKLFNMASALDSLYGSGPFNVLDNVTLLEKIIEPEYENKTSQRFQIPAETGSSRRRTTVNR